MTRDEVKILLETLSVAYPAQASKIENKKLMVDLWEGYLKEYSGELVFAAVKAYIGNHSHRFFPSVGEIVNAARRFDGMSNNVNGMSKNVNRYIEAPKTQIPFENSYCQLCPFLKEGQQNYCDTCVF